MQGPRSEPCASMMVCVPVSAGECVYMFKPACVRGCDNVGMEVCAYERVRDHVIVCL